ncbi:alpha/beta fold hydrolase [Kineococcus esterisolvens]|uniref:alpha/beta fold hydrolase n=1 Tax=unclassified Kineococcus TaxID=2621656 RepID=UPI003D7D270F
MLDLPGSCRSSALADPGGYRCDRLVDVVEYLRQHLGLQRIDVLAHSAGTNLALLHAEPHPDRVRRLVLVGPGGAAVGVRATGEQRRAVADLRSSQPWFLHASRVLNALLAADVGAGGAGEQSEIEQALAPFSYGRWDPVAQAHHAAGRHQRAAAAATVYAAPGGLRPAAHPRRAGRGGRVGPAGGGRVRCGQVPSRWFATSLLCCRSHGSSCRRERGTCRGSTTAHASSGPSPTFSHLDPGPRVVTPCHDRAAGGKSRRAASRGPYRGGVERQRSRAWRVAERLRLVEEPGLRPVGSRAWWRRLALALGAGLGANILLRAFDLFG